MNQTRARERARVHFKRFLGSAQLYYYTFAASIPLQTVEITDFVAWPWDAAMLHTAVRALGELYVCAMGGVRDDMRRVRCRRRPGM